MIIAKMWDELDQEQKQPFIELANRGVKKTDNNNHTEIRLLEKKKKRLQLGFMYYTRLRRKEFEEEGEKVPESFMQEWRGMGDELRDIYSYKARKADYRLQKRKQMIVNPF